MTHWLSAPNTHTFVPLVNGGRRSQRARVAPGRLSRLSHSRKVRILGPRERFLAAPDEIDWIRLAQGGDSAAFAQLVRLHQRRVFACAYRVVKRTEDADDVAQETFLRAFRALPRFDFRSELSTWLFRICVNVALNHLRKNKRHQVAAQYGDEPNTDVAADPSQVGVNPEVMVRGAQVEGRVQRALQGLSEQLRTTVELVLIEGVSQVEASRVLGCSEGTINWRIHEARRRLRESLADVLREDELASAVGGAS